MAKQLKSPIKMFNEHLTEEQHEAKKTIDKHTLTMLNGRAGCGKTHLAVCYAMEQLALHKKKVSDVERVVITRATVMLKEHNNGFLPGDIQEKFDPWLQPIYDNMFQFLPKGEEDLKLLQDKKTVEIVPLSYVQGRTFSNAVIIVDEAQNLTDQEIEMLFTRIGVGSKMILCGDMRQQLVEGKSGLEALQYMATKSERVARVTLLNNYRHPIVIELLDLYEEYRFNERESEKESKQSLGRGERGDRAISA